MLRYPSSEIKITVKDLTNAEEIQRQYLKSYQKKRQQQIDDQEHQKQQQDQDQSPPHNLSSLSFTYDSPERLDASISLEEVSIISTNRINAAESSFDRQQQQQQQQQQHGTKRPTKDTESSQRKLSSQEQRNKTNRQQ